MLIALIASVPAFYDSMMPTPATWATWMYLVGGVVLLGSAWQVQRSVGNPNHIPSTGRWGDRPGQIKLDVFLGIALMANAVLPQSNEAEPALIWRPHTKQVKGSAFSARRGRPRWYPLTLLIAQR